MATQTVIYHPGIENEYLFNSWDEAREYLELHHEGLASGMLFNCREIALTDLAARLDAAGVECQGREWNNTLINNIGQGAEVLRLTDMSPADKAELRRVLRLSPDRWAKWYYTDPAGNAVLLCWARWEA